MTANDSTQGSNAKTAQRFSGSYDGHGYIAAAAPIRGASKWRKLVLLRVLYFKDDGSVAVAQGIDDPMGGTVEALTSTLTPLHEIPKSRMRKETTKYWPARKDGGMARLRRGIGKPHIVAVKDMASAMLASAKGKFEIDGTHGALVAHYEWFDLGASLELRICNTRVSEHERVFVSDIRRVNSIFEFPLTEQQVAQQMADRVAEFINELCR